MVTWLDMLVAHKAHGAERLQTPMSDNASQGVDTDVERSISNNRWLSSFGPGDEDTVPVLQFFDSLP